MSDGGDVGTASSARGCNRSGASKATGGCTYADRQPLGKALQYLRSPLKAGCVSAR